MTEHAPAWSNPRMTKAQMRKYLANLKAIQEAAKKKLDPNKEHAEKHAELSELEYELDNIFWWETVGYYIGIDIWGSSIKYLLRMNGDIISSWSQSTNLITNNEDIIEIIYNIIDPIIQEYWLTNIKGIWIGSKWRVTTTWLIQSSSFKPLAGLNFKAILEEKYKITTTVVNDASLPYYALQGSQKYEKNILCLTLWTGIGTAIFLKGKKFGDETFSSQFSSTPFKASTHEAYASVKFLLNKAQENDIIAETPSELSELIESNGTIIRSIFAEYGANIWEMIAKIVEDAHIDTIYISGWISKSKHLFEENIQDSLHKYSHLTPHIIFINEPYEVWAYGASKLAEENTFI